MKGLAVLVIFTLFGISGIMAASVDPVTVDPWEPGDACDECDEATACGDYGWKIETINDIIQNGVYDTSTDQFDNDPVLPPNNAMITISDCDGSSFNWSSDQPVCTVIVKGGTAAHVYSYPDGAYEDTDLTAPINPANGEPFDVSHITFCWNVYEWNWGTMSIAYEDLPKDMGNDWDYNDVVIDINTNGITENGELLGINFTFVPETRTAAYVHTFNFSLYADVFGSDGTYHFKRSGEAMMSGDYYYDQVLDMTIIEDTSDFPAMVTLNITFDVPFAFTYPVWYGTNVHGENLFYNPSIDVWNTGEIIDVGDVRLLTIPVDWDWPMPDGTPIWDDAWYPKVAAGDPPGFPPDWWIN